SRRLVLFDDVLPTIEVHLVVVLVAVVSVVFAYFLPERQDLRPSGAEQRPHLRFARVPGPEIERQGRAPNFVRRPGSSRAAGELCAKRRQNSAMMIDDGRLPASRLAHRNEDLLCGIERAFFANIEPDTSALREELEGGIQGTSW